MADRARRRVQQRRRAVVLGTAGALVAAGAGTAWALTGSGGPAYRLASAERSDITQTVEADGALAAKDSSSVAFAANGTVSSVRVRVGDKVHAGDTLATLDKADLQAAVTSARKTLAQARQRLADDEQAQLSGSSSSSSSGSLSSAASNAPSSTPSAASSRSADSATDARLISTTVPKGPGGDTTGAAGAVRAAQQAVETAQRALDEAIARVSTDVDAASAACTSAAADPSTLSATADAGGTVSGTVGKRQVVVTLLDATTSSTNPQTVAGGGSYTFAGLTAGHSYTVVLVPQMDTAACSAALDTLRDDHSSVANSASVVSAKAALDNAIESLDQAVAALGSTSYSTPSGSTPAGSAARPTGSSAGPTGAAPSSSSKNQSSDNSSPSGSTVTAQQIAADTQAIDAAKAQLAVAKHDLGYSTLTTPISGTVGAVNITKGDAVAASSSTATITVVGSGALSADLNIGLADIDLVKVGEKSRVTVDGRSKPLAATVSYVGATNTSDSTGSSSTYLVTVSLDAADASLFDGMGASVAIDVGEARDALSVPISAVHTTGTLHTVTVYAHGSTSTKVVTLGVEGADRVQIKSGLSAGDQVVLAEIDKSIPSSDSNQFGRNGNSFNRLTSGGGGGPVFKGGGPPG